MPFMYRVAQNLSPTQVFRLTRRPHTISGQCARASHLRIRTANIHIGHGRICTLQVTDITPFIQFCHLRLVLKTFSEAVMAESMAAKAGVSQHTPRRKRKPLSCEPCRISKLRCDRRQPCATCLRRTGVASCVYSQRDNATVSSAAKSRALARSAQPASQSRLISPPQQDTPRSPSPQPIHHRWDTILRRPPNEKGTEEDSTGVVFSLSFGPTTPVLELLALLPSESVCEYLVSQYFTYIAPLFHILHGPTFQIQYSNFSRDPEKTDLSWLALLFAMCSQALKTIDDEDSAPLDLWKSTSEPRDLRALSLTYRNAAMMCLSQDQFLVRQNLSTLETLLILIHTISDGEGAENGWILLGNALNIGVALRCHKDSGHLNTIDRERRRRCWAGIQILHTYQALLFRDMDLSVLCNIKAEMPADANDDDIREDVILAPRPSSFLPQTTQMTFMRHRIRIFELSTRICAHICGPDRLDRRLLNSFDEAIAQEEQLWNSIYLVNGSRSILDPSSYAQLCILQTYAHQLYLLIHRPFHNNYLKQFESKSRERCITSSLALIDVHRQFCELPRFKGYRWLANGTLTCNVVHGAVALTSCISDSRTDPDFDSYLAVIDAAIQRLCMLRNNSRPCANVYLILRQLQ